MNPIWLFLMGLVGLSIGVFFERYMYGKLLRFKADCARHRYGSPMEKVQGEFLAIMYEDDYIARTQAYIKVKEEESAKKEDK